MVRTDVFRRGVPWMLLIKRTGTLESDLNVSRRQKACVAVTGLTLLAGLCSPLLPLASIGVPAGLAAIVGLNFDLFRLFARRGGFALTVAAVPLHCLYYCCCGLSVLIAQFYWLAQKRPTDTIRSASRERTDKGARSIPKPAAARRPLGLARWRAKAR